MKSMVNVLEGQMNNFILFSLGTDIDKKCYFDSKIYQDNFNYSYNTRYEWRYDNIDENILDEFLNGN